MLMSGAVKPLKLTLCPSTFTQSEGLKLFDFLQLLIVGLNKAWSFTISFTSNSLFIGPMLSIASFISFCVPSFGAKLIS